MSDTQQEATATPAVPVDEDRVLSEFFDHARNLTVEDDGAVQERILRNLLKATTREDILRAGEAMPASEVFGMPLRVEGIRASESSYEEGAEHYLHVDAVIISNGDHVTFSCGARDVVMKLIRLHQLDMLPVSVVIDKAAKATKDGYYPVFMRGVADDGEPF